MLNFREILVKLGVERKDDGRQCMFEVRPDGLRFALIDQPKELIVDCQAFSTKQREKYGPAALTSNLYELVKHYNLKGAKCGVVLHPHYYRLHVVDTPDVPRAEYRKAVRWQLRDIIDLPLDEICLDVFLGEANRGNDKLNVVSAKKQKLQEFADCFLQAGLQIQFMDIREFAIRNLLVQMYGSQGVWSAICLEDEQCTMQVVSNGYLQFVRRVPVDIDSLMRGEVSRLVAEIKRSWEYVNGEFALPKPGRLMIMPTVNFSMQVLKELNEKLNTAVVPMHFEERHYKRLSIDGDFEASRLESCWAAIGGSYRMLGFGGIE